MSVSYFHKRSAVDTFRVNATYVCSGVANWVIGSSQGALTAHVYNGNIPKRINIVVDISQHLVHSIN